MTLTSLIVFPLMVSFILVFLRNERIIRFVTLGAGFIEMGLAVPLSLFDIHAPGFQFVEHYAWVPQWGLSYYLGIDGISLLMILLTILLLPLCVLCSWKYIGKRIKEFHICLLLMISVCIGVFAALDMVLFYVFWEAMLVPMYLIIAVWGGPRRKYASIKFIVYTLAASTLLLVAIIAFYFQTGTFSIPEIMASKFSFRFQFWAFLALALAFAVKVPMFPFHTWLPAAHVEAPTA
ncbi:MAG: proton-conducting transporter membrane subunit, partial [Desulfoplanes sp.]